MRENVKQSCNKFEENRIGEKRGKVKENQDVATIYNPGPNREAMENSAEAHQKTAERIQGYSNEEPTKNVGSADAVILLPPGAEKNIDAKSQPAMDPHATLDMHDDHVPVYISVVADSTGSTFGLGTWWPRTPDQNNLFCGGPLRACDHSFGSAAIWLTDWVVRKAYDLGFQRIKIFTPNSFLFFCVNIGSVVESDLVQDSESHFGNARTHAFSKKK